MPDPQKLPSADETASLTQVMALLDEALETLDDLGEDLASAHLAGTRDIIAARLSR